MTMKQAHMIKSSRNVLLKSATQPSDTIQFRNLRVFLWAALIAGILFAVRYFGSGPLRELLQWISGLGSTAPLVFIPLYVVACVLFIPGSILTLSAGFLFGVVRGSMYVSLSCDRQSDAGLPNRPVFRPPMGRGAARQLPEVQGSGRGGRPRRMENRSAYAALPSVSFQPTELRLRPDQR